jgi:hypothetical protein
MSSQHNIGLISLGLADRFGFRGSFRNDLEVRIGSEKKTDLVPD